jgi:hypothetical protein
MLFKEYGTINPTSTTPQAVANLEELLCAKKGREKKTREKKKMRDTKKTERTATTESKSSSVW